MMPHCAHSKAAHHLSTAEHLACAVGVMQAKESYESFVQATKDAYVADRVKDGVFGAMMDVSLVNDGPVTCDTPPIATNKLVTGSLPATYCFLTTTAQLARTNVYLGE